ncbi:MAG TPA: family 16 glycoside hydrolase [Anaerolineae bacterium]
MVADTRRVFILVLLVLVGGVVGCSRATLQPVVELDPNVLYHDEFVAGETGEWQIEGDSAGQTAVINEQLIIELNAPHTLQFATLNNLTFANFVLEVDARQVRGDVQNSYGVLFRLQDPGRFYRFEITGSGLYMLERRNADGTWTRFLEDWAPSPAINQGINASNRLKVVAAGPVLSAYVNDVLLQEVNDDAYVAGAIALDAGTFNQPVTYVAFDNLVVRQP